MSACGCRVDYVPVAGAPTQPTITGRIVYCALHARAEQLAAFLAKWFPEGDPAAQWPGPAWDEARQLLRESGRPEAGGSGASAPPPNSDRRRLPTPMGAMPAHGCPDCRTEYACNDADCPRPYEAPCGCTVLPLGPNLRWISIEEAREIWP